MSPPPVVARWDALALDHVTEMVARKAVAGTETTLVQAYFKKGTVVPMHEHPVEILVYVLQGAVRVQVGGQVATIREGEVLTLPRGVAHQAECLDDTFVLTVAPTHG